MAWGNCTYLNVSCQTNFRCVIKFCHWVHMFAGSVSNLQLVEMLDFLWCLHWDTQDKLHLLKNFFYAENNFNVLGMFPKGFCCSYAWSWNVCEWRTPFAWGLPLENSANSLLCFWVAALHSLSYFFFLYWLPSALCWCLRLFHLT